MVRSFLHWRLQCDGTCCASQRAEDSGCASEPDISRSFRVTQGSRPAPPASRDRRISAEGTASSLRDRREASCCNRSSRAVPSRTAEETNLGKWSDYMFEAVVDAAK